MLPIRTSIGASLLALCLCLPFFPAQAQGLGGFAIDNFESEIGVKKDGSFLVTENITIRFLEPRHGLFRFIPVEYTKEDNTKERIRLRVTGVTRYDIEEDFEMPERFSAYRQGPFMVIKIGQADTVVTGLQLYRFSYEVENALLFHQLEDELYWNVTGHEWGVELPKVSAKFTLENARDLRTFKAKCYSGPLGQDNGRCQVAPQYDAIEFSTDGPMTISVRWPKTLINEPSSRDLLRWWYEDHWDIFLLLLPLITFFILLRVWWYHGRDPDRRRTIVAQYEPPADLRPSEVGTLLDARFHERDFAAAVVDLAVRGYLKIIEKTDKVLIFSHTDYSFEKLKDADDTLKPFEKDILAAIFGGEGQTTLHEREKQLVAARQEAGDKVFAAMAADGYYVRNPKTARWTYAGIGIALGAAGIVFGMFAYEVTARPLAHIAFFATAGLFLVFAPFMPKRTEKGAIAADVAQGFKLFLETAEKYRLEWQEKEGIFEKYLPYAIVLGVADKWAKALAVQAKQAPAWYVGPSITSFNATNFTNSITSFVNAAAVVSAPKSSGGGGGSSGGSSGGGFGGGGGGSW